MIELDNGGVVGMADEMRPGIVARLSRFNLAEFHRGEYLARQEARAANKAREERKRALEDTWDAMAVTGVCVDSDGNPHEVTRADSPSEWFRAIFAEAWGSNWDPTTCEDDGDRAAKEQQDIAEGRAGRL